MNLLMISGDRSVASGKESAFFRTLQYLDATFDRVDVLCPKVSGEPVRQLFNNVYMHPAPVGRLLFPFWVRIAGKTIGKDADVMTVHDYPPFLNGIGARLLLRTLNIPSILEIHHLVGEPKAASVTERIGRVMNKVILPSHANRFTKIRVVNETVKKELVQRGVDSEKIHVVPSVYLDQKTFRADETIEKKYDFVFSGRLVENKGLLTVLSAIKRVPNATLLVIGDGPLLKKAKKFVEKNALGGRLTFLGWLGSVQEVIRSLQSASVFIMHSTSEGNPRVAIEAMALGLPVIATRVGIIPDVIEDGRNGFFVSGSEDDLVRAMKQVLSSEESIQTMGKAAAEDVYTFNAEKTLKGYADFLSSLQ